MKDSCWSLSMLPELKQHWDQGWGAFLGILLWGFTECTWAVLDSCFRTALASWSGKLSEDFACPSRVSNLPCSKISDSSSHPPMQLPLRKTCFENIYHSWNLGLPCDDLYCWAKALSFTEGSTVRQRIIKHCFSAMSMRLEICCERRGKTCGKVCLPVNCLRTPKRSSLCEIWTFRDITLASSSELKACLQNWQPNVVKIVMLGMSCPSLLSNCWVPAASNADMIFNKSACMQGHL